MANSDADENRSASVVLCWHMHQPVYQDLKSGTFVFPWVYLHAIKDYSDMAAHLENHPGARAVVNFAPVLLEQINEYLVEIERWRSDGKMMGDPLLGALVSRTLPEPGTPAYLKLVDTCLKANPERIIKRFPAYAGLAALAEYYRDRPEIQIYLGHQFLADLLVWYHLGWIGESIRHGNESIRRLQEKARNYTHEERLNLLDVITDILADIGPRYRALAETGQVELSVSPYAHPMLPLLMDLGSAREAMPDIALPQHTRYPGGEERARWQLEQARHVFLKFFGIQPRGCWASEGGLSQPVLDLLAAQGFAWTASGDSVLHNSLKKAKTEGYKTGAGTQDIHTLFRFGESSITVFFRDDGLSDLIGFTYSDWHAEDAVNDLVHHMETIAAGSGQESPCIISIIMDGENAWEYFPDNAWYFLDELYRRLASHTSLRLTTFSALAADCNAHSRQLPGLVAGSWIYGTFSTWIGDGDKNRAWDLLCEAKQHFDEALHRGELSTGQLERATHQLALCEGSDWFWWFGDYNPPEVVADFDQLFRRHLANLYDLIGIPVPPHLFQRISHGGGLPARGGAMRTGHAGQEGG